MTEAEISKLAETFLRPPHVLARQEAKWEKRLRARNEATLYIRYSNTPADPDDVPVVELKEFHASGEPTFTRVEDFREWHWKLLRLILKKKGKAAVTVRRKQS